MASRLSTRSTWRDHPARKAARKKLQACWQGNRQHARFLLLVILSDYCCDTQALTDIAEVLLTVVPIVEG